MANNVKNILIDGQKVTANLHYLGDELVWVTVKGKEHIVPRKFWDGTVRSYKEPLGGPRYGRIEGDEEEGNKPPVSKTMLLNGIVLGITEIHSTPLWVTVRDSMGDSHILPREFFEGKVPCYITRQGRYDSHIRPPPHQELIQRIEYVLHSGYDATDRELLREALAALKERA